MTTKRPPQRVCAGFCASKLVRQKSCLEANNFSLFRYFSNLNQRSPEIGSICLADSSTSSDGRFAIKYTPMYSLQLAALSSQTGWANQRPYQPSHRIHSNRSSLISCEHASVYTKRQRLPISNLKSYASKRSIGTPTSPKSSSMTPS